MTGWKEFFTHPHEYAEIIVAFIALIMLGVAHFRKAHIDYQKMAAWAAVIVLVFQGAERLEKLMGESSSTIDASLYQLKQRADNPFAKSIIDRLSETLRDIGDGTVSTLSTTETLDELAQSYAILERGGSVTFYNPVPVLLADRSKEIEALERSANERGVQVVYIVPTTLSNGQMKVASRTAQLQVPVEKMLSDPLLRNGGMGRSFISFDSRWAVDLTVVQLASGNVLRGRFVWGTEMGSLQQVEDAARRVAAQSEPLPSRR